MLSSAGNLGIGLKVANPVITGSFGPRDGIPPRRSHGSPSRQRAIAPGAVGGARAATYGHGHQPGRADQHVRESRRRVGLSSALGALGNAGLGRASATRLGVG